MRFHHTRESVLALVDSASDPDGCHLWTGPRSSDGYGQVKYDGKIQRGHRLVWQFANGPIPPGLVIGHHCDTPLCCRLDHLFLTTIAGNCNDRHAKGRDARGDQHGARRHPERLARGDAHWSRHSPERHGYRVHPERHARGEQVGCAKLNAVLVTEIRALYEAGGATYLSLALQFGVAPATIRDIIKRYHWQHVP